MIPRPFVSCCAALSALALFGCPNAEGEFDNFQDRYETVHPDMTSGAGGGSACASVPKAGEIDGDAFDERGLLGREGGAGLTGREARDR